jgi:hypothetical protein
LVLVQVVGGDLSNLILVYKHRTPFLFFLYGGRISVQIDSKQGTFLKQGGYTEISCKILLISTRIEFFSHFL